MHGFLSPIESNERQLFCGENVSALEGKYFFKYFNFHNLVQNSLFYNPEFIWAFLIDYNGLILSLKSP